MVSDSWPALHGRPVLRRTIAVGLVLAIALLAALAVRGVNALTLGRGAIETDRDRAELLAGLHPSQHPGAGRYYVPVGAVYTRLADGVPVAYLHYRLAGGPDVGVDDFLRTYDLPAPGPLTALPSDLTAALGGDEPSEAHELAPMPTPSGTTSPTVPLTVSLTASPTASSTGDPTTSTAPPSGTEPAPTPAEPVVTPSPASPSPCASDEASDAPGARPTGSPAEDDEDAEGSGDSEGSGDTGSRHRAGLRSADDPPAPTATPDPALSPTTILSPSESPSESPTPTVTPAPAPTATVTPTPTAGRPAAARRIYVVTVSNGLSGAADIYVRATG
ncbi:hypothetical protein OH807_29320 [Kitasatospora sp. NBC_01560]|uniref:hypothetical protein n=1 Tax=Kitasatospora sp. NBC_01560 TaxID=2975965 RepID=UPI00386906AE